MRFVYKGKVIEYIKISPPFWRKIINLLLGNHPHVLFLHGFCDPFQNHINLLRNLARRGYTVWAVSFPGHTGSQNWDRVTWEDLRDMVIEFCNYHRIIKPTLLGFSLGGGVALKIASEGRFEISNLRLIAPLNYAVDSTNPEVLERFLKIGAQTAITLIKKHQALAKYDTTYVLSHYAGLFPQYEFNNQNLTTPTKVILMQNEDLLQNDKISAAFAGNSHVQIVILPEMRHDLFNISEAQLDAIIKQLF